MLHPSTKKLIDKLGEMTRKQRVSWIEGENGTIVHDTEGYRVVLTPEPHGVILTDAVGREIETCSPEEIADEKDADGRPYPVFVRELFTEAHRHARGAEKAIRTLLAGLEAADEETAVEAAPEPEPEPEPESVTDETTSFEGEGEITAAVATMADQINGAALTTETEEAEEEPAFIEEAVVEAAAEEIAAEDTPAAEAEEPVAEPVLTAEPAALPAAYAEPEEAEETPEVIEAADDAPVLEAEAEPEPEAEPVVETAAPEAESEAEPEPEQAPPAAPVSSPMQQRFSLSGIPYGMGVAGTQPVSPPQEQPLESAASEPRTLVIDGTEDLPESAASFAEGDAPSAGRAGNGEDTGPQPVPPRRFNPWN